eukprot:TRINITY_DN1943_c0_g1_i1.p1 TRINITY_DN1943_c0_g1~~TRINITY_DN1943_c0_g1_i1.p1  ORF type:complete len:289 (+),score=41.29 TRINITY_DN1943_c0_g1_i1:100-966(+)
MWTLFVTLTIAVLSFTLTGAAPQSKRAAATRFNTVPPSSTRNPLELKTGQNLTAGWTGHDGTPFKLSVYESSVAFSESIADVTVTEPKEEGQVEIPLEAGSCAGKSGCHLSAIPLVPSKDGSKMLPMTMNSWRIKWVEVIKDDKGSGESTPTEPARPQGEKPGKSGQESLQSSLNIEYTYDENPSVTGTFTITWDPNTEILKATTVIHPVLMSHNREILHTLPGEAKVSDGKLESKFDKVITEDAHLALEAGGKIVPGSESKGMFKVSGAGMVYVSALNVAMMVVMLL